MHLIQLNLDCLSALKLTFLNIRQMINCPIRKSFRVTDNNSSDITEEKPCISYLSAALRVERRGAQDDSGAFSIMQHVDQSPITPNGDNVSLARLCVFGQG